MLMGERVKSTIRHRGEDGDGREVVAGGEQPVHRRDVDDATTARLLHHRHSVLRREEVGLDPDLERVIPAHVVHSYGEQAWRPLLGWAVATYQSSSDRSTALPLDEFGSPRGVGISFLLPYLRASACRVHDEG